MEDLVKTLNFTSEESLPKEVWNAIQTRLKREKDVHYEQVRSNQVKISFPSYLYSSEYILNLLQDSGFHRKSKDKKSLWEKLLNPIIKGNMEAYGDQPLECCKLNK